MNYSLHTLTKVADCEILLELANNKKLDLTFKKMVNERATKKHAQITEQLTDKLNGLIEEISAMDTLISLVSDARTKEDLLDRKSNLECRKFLIENRKDNFGPVALIEKEINLACLTHDIQETEAFIKVLEAKKLQLKA